MGTPVDFWTLEDCVKALSDLSESRAEREETIEKVAAFVSRRGDEGATSMSGYSRSEDAIRQLLAEAGALDRQKERDLELAAQIGSRLLEQNKDLENRLEVLDTQLASANDRAQQLRHELSQKEQLVQVYSRICEEAQGEEVWPSHPSTHASPQHLGPGGYGSAGASPDVFSPRTTRRGVLSTGLDQLQTQITQLEEENNDLRRQHDQLLARKSDRNERTVVEDCLKQLSDANTHIRNLSEDLSKKTDKFMERQTEVTDLFTRSVEMENRVKTLTGENLSLNDRLWEAQSSQQTLTSQLVDLRDKYDQCLTMLSQAHTEIRRVQSQQQKQEQRQQQQPSPRLPANLVPKPAPTTLAAELEESLLAEVEEDDVLLPSVASYSEISTCSMPQTAAIVSGVTGPRRSSYPWDLRPDRDPSDSTSASSSLEDEEVEAAVAESEMRRRRSRRRRQHRGAKRLQPYQQQQSAQAKWSPAVRLGGAQPLQDKVQMVKSMEGSTTLRQWQRLAKPSMSGALFERRPGVRVRGCSNTGGGGLGLGLGGLCSDSDAESEPAAPATAAPVTFGLGGLGMEAAGDEKEKEEAKVEEKSKEAARKEKEKKEEEDREVEEEVRTITFRMSSAPPDPTRTLEALGQRRVVEDKRARVPSLPESDEAASTSLAEILSERGIRSKTYEQLVDEGFPVLPTQQQQQQLQEIPRPATPMTPRNSPTAEMESNFARAPNALAVPGPVNPTLVFAGLLESLSELFKPFGSGTLATSTATSMRQLSSSLGSLRRNFSAESNLDGGLNLVAAASPEVPAVVHRTSSSAVSPRKK